ncbi:MAG: MtrB/PioB family decaheme-associated outer membrane protein, partial [Burkholderiales bacterium]
TSFVELGATNVSNGSDKFGEYNGLNQSGVYGVGNLDVRGGDGYNGGTTRWDVYGKDLGTTSREFGVDASDQGTWNFGVHRDELRHYITDSFQTPFLGTMGGNSFALPSNFGIVNTSSPTTAVAVALAPRVGTMNLSSIQRSDFQGENIYSGRTNTGLTAGAVINKQWSVQFEFNRLAQDGAKLISAGSDSINIAGSPFPLKGEAPVMLANPTNFATDTTNLSVNWVGEKSHFTGSLYGSIFHDANSSVSWTTPYFSPALATAPTGTALGTAYPIDALSTLPSNTFTQINLAGGTALTATTKLVGGVSYGRNTQNESYVNVPGGVDNMMAAGGLPQNSLDGVIKSKHADLRLVDQTTKELALSGGLKYNERDNQTAANTYTYYDIGGGGPNIAVSTPVSNKKTQFDLTGDYKIDRSQNVRLSYDYEKIERWCDSSLSNNAQSTVNPKVSTPVTSTSTAAYYGASASCVQVPNSIENKVGVSYKIKPTDDLSLNASYSYADRKANVLSAFYNPMQGVDSGEGYENKGYIAFFDASRNEKLFKAGVNWQANERFNIGLNGKYTKDNYDDSTLGVQNGSMWSVNLDGTYQLAEKSSVSAYASAQKRERDLLSEATKFATTIQPQFDWQNSFSDKDYTVGLNLKQAGLMSGKLSLAADLTYSDSKTGWNTSILGSGSASLLAACGAVSTAGYNCGATPDITTKLSQLKLSGLYALSKQGQVGFGVSFQHLNSDDYIYNAYQMGYTPTSVMPSNQSSPSYSVSTMYVVYRYSFAAM